MVKSQQKKSTPQTTPQGITPPTTGTPSTAFQQNSMPLGAGNPFTALGGMPGMAMPGGAGMPDMSAMINNPVFQNLMSQMVY